MTAETHTHPQTLRQLVIVGAGGHAVSVANVAQSTVYSVKYFVDKTRNGESLLGVGIIGDIAELSDLSEFDFAIAVGDNALRERIYKQLSSQHTGLRFPPLVHSSATISFFTNVGDGTVVMPNAVVGPNSNLGKFCILNTQASIDHDCSMADFSSLAPGAIVGGTVHIGSRSAVSIGAVVKHGLTIGDDCVIGANSYLNKDLPANQVAYGTPAKRIRSRKVGDSYL